MSDNTGQTSFDNFGEDAEEPDTSSGYHMETATLSDKAVVTEESCPWCLHPSDEFTRELSNSDNLACPNCHARIPEDEDWYQRGDKICLSTNHSYRQ